MNKKCESDGTLLTSYPAQLRCKNCGATWVIGDSDPDCKVFKKECLDEIHVKDNVYTHCDGEMVKVCKIGSFRRENKRELAMTYGAYTDIDVILYQCNKCKKVIIE